MEGLSAIRSCLPFTSVTSQKSSKDATSSAENLASPLHINNPWPGASQIYHRSSQALISLRNITRHRTTLCEPEFLDIIWSPGDSRARSPKDAETGLLQEVQSSDKVEVVKRLNSVICTNFAPVIAPVWNRPSIPLEIITYRFQEFERLYKDRLSEKFLTLIANEDSAGNTRSCKVNLVLYGDFVEHQFVGGFVQTITDTQWGDIPNMAGTKSLFIPKCFEGVQSSAETTIDPSKPMSWELGFVVPPLVRSMRNGGKLDLIRYTVEKDQKTFKAFLGADKVRQRLAWNSISLIINPGLRNNTTSEGFEHVAADFFAGKEVLSQEQYEHHPPPNLMRSKSYKIIYNAPRLADEVWEACYKNPVMFRFLMDCLLCNELENARQKSLTVNWLGDARVRVFQIGHNSKDPEIKALSGILKSGRKDASQECAVGDLTLSSFTKMTKNNDYPEIDSDSDATIGHSEPAGPSRNAKAGNDKHKTSSITHLGLGITVEENLNKRNEEDRINQWMKISDDNETEKTPKSSSKKRNKIRNKNKKAKSKSRGKVEGDERSQITSTPDVDFEQESRKAEEEEASPNDPYTVLATSNNFNDSSLYEQSGNLSIVQKRLTSRQNRSLETSPATNRATMRGEFGVQARPPVAPQFSKHTDQIHFSKSPPGQLHSGETPRVLMSKDSIAEKLATTPKNGLGRQNRVASNAAKEFLEMQIIIQRKSEQSRTLNSEEFRAISTNSSPLRKSAITPTLDGSAEIPSHFLETADEVNGGPYGLLLTKEEASRVNYASQRICIRSDRYSSNGVSIPNFYCILEDEESCTEKATQEIETISFADVPSVRPATNSTACVPIPNLFVTPLSPPTFRTSYQLPDAESQPDLVHFVDADSIARVEVADRTTSNFQTSTIEVSYASEPLLSERDKFHEEAIYIDSNALECQTSTPSTDGSYGETSCPSKKPFVEASLLSLASDEDLEVINIIPKVDEWAISMIVNELKFEATVRLLDANQPQESDESEQEKSASVSDRDADKSLQPVEVTAALQIANPDVIPAQNFDNGPPAEGAKIDSPPLMNASASFDMGGETSQLTSQGEATLEEYRESPTGGDRNAIQGTNASINSARVDADSSQPPQQLIDPPLTKFMASCTYCGERTVPSVEARQVICAGCGPLSAIRYCSVACLLVHSLDHARYCLKYPASARAAYHNLPRKYFIYVLNPITPQLGYFETPERSRQKAFSMYCSSGPFPKLLKTWMKKFGVADQDQQTFDTSEYFKKTGDYAVFRSDRTSPSPRLNPNAEVIFTIKLHPLDPQKQMLRRTLNACYLVWDIRMVEFLYRFINQMIVIPCSFDCFKYIEPVEVVWPEFDYQFKQEFNFNFSMLTPRPDFDAFVEWNYLSTLLLDLENLYPVLRQWYRV